jgi:cellulose synthase/poly-beta-1,6-N-acetylglucosamine synthase-like glycosyltransferase
MTDLPFVTMAVPCFNEERYIEAFFDDVSAQDYPKDRIEIVIADGMSTDRTRAILERLSGAFEGRLRVIDNPRRLQAAAMNAIVEQCRGDVVVRLDVHARYANDFVRQCVSVLKETGAQNVGGPARPLAKGWFQKAVCAALDSKLAVGNSKYRDPNAEGWVDTVFPGAFPREVLERVGGFDPNAVTNEDAEINQRIHEAGGRVYLSQKIIVHYFPRDSYRGLAKQYFKYGKGRARTMLKHGGLPTVRPLLPFALVISGGVLLLTSPLQPLTPFAFGLYGLLSAVEAVRVTRHKSLLLAPVVASLFPVIHVCHGIGFGVGLLAYGLAPDWESARTRGDTVLQAKERPLEEVPA